MNLWIILFAICFVSNAYAGTFIYVGNAGSQDLTIFELKSGGELSPVATSAFEPESNPELGSAQIKVVPPGVSAPLAVSPDKQFLYVGARNDSHSTATLAVSFAIDPESGKLTLLGSYPLANLMPYIITDRSGKFLLSASIAGSEVTVNPIRSDGIVQKVQQIVAIKPDAHCIMTDPSNRYALITGYGGDIIQQEKFDAKNGKLLPNNPLTVSVKAKAGPRHLVFSPNEKFVYLINELDASIYVFPWDAKNGTLKKEIQITTSLPKNFSGKPWAADIHITPDGKFLYASERTSSTLAAFRVDPKTGMLTSIDSYPTEKKPRAFNIDPTGSYLLSVGQLSNSLTIYKIDKETGKLTKLRQYPVGKIPSWVEIVDTTHLKTLKE